VAHLTVWLRIWNRDRYPAETPRLFALSRGDGFAWKPGREQSGNTFLSFILTRGGLSRRFSGWMGIGIAIITRSSGTGSTRDT